MSIEFDCPNCGNHIRIRDEFAGKVGACKKCGQRLMIPESTPSTRHPALTVAEDTPKASKRLPSLNQDVPTYPAPAMSFSSPHTVSEPSLATADPGLPFVIDVGASTAGNMKNTQTQSQPTASQRLLSGIGNGLGLFIALWLFCLINFWPFLVGLTFSSGKPPTALPISKYAEWISRLSLSRWAIVGFACCLALGLITALFTSEPDNVQAADA